MRPLTMAVAAGALLVATQANAGSFPVNTMTGAQTGLVDQVAVFVYEGRRYCFYFDGWHGPGWYRCGYAFRRGYGWGGVYGWNSWTYGPYERRHHRQGEWQQHHRGDRVGAGSGPTRSRSSVETRTRAHTTTGAQSNTRMRSTTGQSNSHVRSTTGRGGADVKSGGGAKIQGGPTGGPGARGGASVGTSGAGGEKKQ